MKKYLIIGIASLSILFTSCLKDKKVEDRVYGMNGTAEGKIIELAADGHFVLYALDFKNLDTVFGILEIRLAAEKPAPEDLTVVLSLANSVAILADYNAANGTNLVQFPVNLYTLPNGLSVTIPAGSRSVFIKLGTNSVNFDPSATYGLGFKIVSVSKAGYTISGNFGTAIAAFAAKNKYDGVYNLKGFHNRSSPDYTAPYDEEVEMITSGPNSVYMYWEPAGGPAHPIAGGTGAYSVFTTNFFFDPVTNALTSWNMSPYPTTLICSVGPATTSRYDPATKKIYAQFYYSNNPTQRGFSDTLTYLHPR